MAQSKPQSRTKPAAAAPQAKAAQAAPRKARAVAPAAAAKTATEVERSGSEAKIREAVKRLNASGAPQQKLKVPQGDLEKARTVAQATSTARLTVENLGGTQRRFVRSPKGA